MIEMALGLFETIVRGSPSPAEAEHVTEHPFETRGYAALFTEKIKSLFDDGHYAQSSFEAFKLIEQILREKTNQPSGFGSGLIKDALGGSAPKVILDCPNTENYSKFRDNFQSMLIGAFGNIRNPKGHKDIDQGLDECLDELTMAAYFIRIIDPPSGELTPSA